jgi:hypothetical protein
MSQLLRKQSAKNSEEYDHEEFGHAPHRVDAACLTVVCCIIVLQGVRKA